MHEMHDQNDVHAQSSGPAAACRAFAMRRPGVRIPGAPPKRRRPAHASRESGPALSPGPYCAQASRTVPLRASG